jgi:hypothetical protein
MEFEQKMLFSGISIGPKTPFFGLSIIFAMHLAPGTTLNNQGSTRYQMQASNLDF